MSKTAIRPEDVLIVGEDTQLGTQLILEEVGFVVVVDEETAATETPSFLESQRPRSADTWDQVAHLEALFEAKRARTRSPR